MPTTIRHTLFTGDKFRTNGVTFTVLDIDGSTVRIEAVTPTDFEINPDEHPDAEVAADAVDPNAAGRTIGGRLPGGVW